MSFYVGVLFFCLQNQGCYFLKLSDTFDKIEQCHKAVRQWERYASAEGIKSEMTCLEIYLKPTI
jgi:hypothetical protein